MSNIDETVHAVTYNPETNSFTYHGIHGETQCFQKGIGQYGHTYWMPTHDDGTTVTQAIPLPTQIIYQGEPMNLEHQDPQDEALAKRIIELKPDGCTCSIDFDEVGMTGKINVSRYDNFHCKIHYPMTATILER